MRTVEQLERELAKARRKIERLERLNHHWEKAAGEATYALGLLQRVMRENGWTKDSIRDLVNEARYLVPAVCFVEDVRNGGDRFVPEGYDVDMRTGHIVPQKPIDERPALRIIKGK